MKTNAYPIAYYCLVALTLAIAPAASFAQVVINAPPTVIGNNFDLNAGETLNVGDGGIVGRGLDANPGSILNIAGGAVGGSIRVYSGSEANISGGTLSSYLAAFSGSKVNVSGGTVYGFEALPGSEARISGGTLGGGFDAALGSDVELFGGDFRLNGAEFNGDSVTLDRSENEAVFTGVLSDGSTFIFSTLVRDNLEGVTLTRVPLPPIDLTPRVVNSPVTDGPSGLRTGQSLTVQAGGQLRDYFAAVNATLNVEGGVIGERSEVVGSTVNISGGDVGQFFYAYPGSEVNISGGTVGFRFEAFDSVVNITDGHVGNLFYVHSDSVVNVTGGKVDSIDAYSGSEVNITGGSIGFGGNLHSSIRAYSGSKVRVSGGTLGRSLRTVADSEVELVGGEFSLNGSPFTDGSITLADEDVFTGTLSDGSAFIFSPLHGDDLQQVALTQVALPAVDLTPRVVDSPVVNFPAGLRAGQTLTLKSGGQLQDNYAVVDATLNVEGGNAGRGVEVTGGVVNISGGDVGAGLSVIDGVVNLSSGSLGERSAAYRGSVVNISGGTAGSKFFAAPGSEVNISGGAFAFDFWARTGSDVELIGNDFHLNGAAYTGDSITLGDEDIFTGTLSDGSTFIFSSRAAPLGDELVGVTLTQVTLPTLDLTPRVVNSPVTGGPSGLRAGQKLTLQAGGVLGDHFAALGAVLNVEGGAVGTGLEVDGSTVNISGGNVGIFFQTYDSEVNISGGEVGRFFRAHPGSTINISGGTVGSFLSFSHFDESIAVNISGGTVVGSFDARLGSVVNMSGGTIVGRLGMIGSTLDISGGNVQGAFAVRSGMVSISGGTIDGNLTHHSGTVDISGGTLHGIFSARSGSETNLFGTQFLLDGVPLNALEIGKAFTITDRDMILSGLLADGTAFRFDLNAEFVSGEDYFPLDALITVTLSVPEPASFALVTLGCCLLLLRRRSGSAGPNYQRALGR